LQRKSGGTANSSTTPVDTILNNSEIKSSDSLTSSESKDDTGKQAKDYLSALSGSSPDRSTVERTRSEDLKYSYKYPSSGDESCNPFYQDATPQHPTEDNKKSPGSLSSTDSKYSSKSVSPFDQESTPKHPAKVSPLKRVTYTDLKMASPDANLEYLIIHIMGFTLTQPVGLALPQSYVTMFDEFHTIDVDDVYEFQYSSTPKVSPDTKLHFMLVKQVQCCIHYACYKESLKDAESDNPTLWSKTEYSTWCQNRYATYLATLAPATATPLLVTSMTATYVSPAQKDDEAALISWNRKPHDVAKYPLLKNDADYQYWKLKMKRQLIADTLSQVTDPTFKLTNCRTGADMELATLQINDLEQILSAVLLNPEGKGLVITHPEDALFVWNQHEAHQTDSNSARISTTALMKKLMTLKIADSPTRHSFLVSFQEFL
jgi:hypothetical protein